LDRVMSAGERWQTAAFSDTPLAAEYAAHESALYEPLPTAAFDPAPYSAGLVQRAGAWWLANMRTEYDSASTFVDLAARLRDIGAPFDIQGLALRMAQDELRHAKIAADVAAAMGVDARIPAAPPARPAPHLDCGAEEAVLRIVIFGCCVSETVNAARLAKRTGEVGDPYVRAAIRLLLADERLHAQFGFYYLEHRRAWLDERPNVKASLARYLRYAFAFLERYMGAVPVDARPLDELERRIGLPDLLDTSASFQEVVLNASIPGLQRFGIEADVAWRERTIAAPGPAT
jgi:hypothetical protein